MRVFPVLFLLFAWAFSAQAALPQRPFSGCGVLITQPVVGDEPAPLTLYAEPGLQRLVQVNLDALPRLAVNQQQPLLAVSATRGEWLKVSLDDAGREGWLELSRSWQYRRWEEYLAGRTVRLLPGMKKTLYAVHGEPRETSPERGALTRDQQVRVIRIEEDWARLEAPAGWIRWRDGDGRLTVLP
jgi:hypothetical protein